jgi:hypothetical protein
VGALFDNTTGADNTAIGNGAGANATTGDGNVHIGADVAGVAGESNHTYIRNINTTEQTPAMDVAFVTVRLSDGRLGYQPPVMHSASSELQETVEELQVTVTQLTQQLKEQAAQIQKVNAQLEASKFATGRIRRGGPAPQVVSNP